jgi:hypothetical protein
MNEADFLVLCAAGADVEALVWGAFVDALRDELDVPEADVPHEDVVHRLRSVRPDGTTVATFTVRLDVADADQVRSIIDSVASGLRERRDEGILKLVKLRDTAMLDHHLTYARELFDIEMALRECLSFIFVDALGEDQFYELLDQVDISVSPKPSMDEMEVHFLNQFFFISFSAYTNANERRKPKDARQLVDLIADADAFEEFKNRLTTPPIANEEYADFIARLKQSLDPVERLRNCVAHNRPVPNKLRNDYEMAKADLMDAMRDFLGRE